MLIDLVCVFWKDAAHYSGCRTLNECKELEPAEQITVGMLVHQDEDKVVIAQSFEPGDAEYDEVMVIARAWVGQMTVLKKLDPYQEGELES